MAGNKIGGAKAALTNKAKYGEDFYKGIALKAREAWEQNGRKPRGFSVNRELARTAGAEGGRNSKRPKKNKE